MKKIKLLVVLYKQDLNSSETILSIKKIFKRHYYKASFELCIWDNSPFPQLNDEVQELKKLCQGLSNINYYHDASNKPLSYVYNTALDTCNDEDFFIILDQDSDFNENFIEEFLSVISNESPELILPVIHYKNAIISPSKIRYIKGEYFSVAPNGNVSAKKLSAINSGMIISLEYIRRTGFRYHQALRNYCTDDYFMREFRKNSSMAYVLKYSFEHSLSLSTLNDNSLTLKKRYKLMKEGRYIVYSGNIWDKCSIRAYFLVHKLYMAIKYKDIDYLKV